MNNFVYTHVTKTGLDCLPFGPVIRDGQHTYQAFMVKRQEGVKIQTFLVSCNKYPTLNNDFAHINEGDLCLFWDDGMKDPHLDTSDGLSLLRFTEKQ